MVLYTPKLERLQAIALKLGSVDGKEAKGQDFNEIVQQGQTKIESEYNIANMLGEEYCDRVEIEVCRILYDTSKVDRLIQEKEALIRMRTQQTQKSPTETETLPLLFGTQHIPPNPNTQAPQRNQNSDTPGAHRKETAPSTNPSRGSGILHTYTNKAGRLVEITKETRRQQQIQQRKREQVDPSEPCAGCQARDHQLKLCVKANSEGYMDGCGPCNRISHQIYECPKKMNNSALYHYVRRIRKNKPPVRFDRDHRELRKLDANGNDISDPNDVPWTAEYSRNNKQFWDGHKHFEKFGPPEVLRADPTWNAPEFVPTQISSKDWHKITVGRYPDIDLLRKPSGAQYHGQTQLPRPEAQHLQSPQNIQRPTLNPLEIPSDEFQTTPIPRMYSFQHQQPSSMRLKVDFNEVSYLQDRTRRMYPEDAIKTPPLQGIAQPAPRDNIPTSSQAQHIIWYTNRLSDDAHSTQKHECGDPSITGRPTSRLDDGHRGKIQRREVYSQPNTVNLLAFRRKEQLDQAYKQRFFARERNIADDSEQEQYHKSTRR